LGAATFFLLRPAAGRGDVVFAALLAAFTAAANTEGGVGRGRGFALEIPEPELWGCDGGRDEGEEDPVGVGVLPTGAGGKGDNAAGFCSLASRFRRI